MYRIDDATASTTLPVPEAALTEGYWTEGNPGTGVVATLERASWFNMVQEELRGIVVAAGLTPSKTTYNQVLLAIRAMTQGSSRVQGLRGANGATPATQMAWTADAVTVRNPTTGAIATIAPAASITTDVSVAGPVANGRDQSIAFTTNTFVHFYYIWNGTTLATISSPTAPTSGGPVLPTGYTNWAFISTVFWNGTTLAIVKVGGCKVSYVTSIALLTGGTATTPTAISVASAVPPNALRYSVAVLQLILAATAAGVYGCRVNLGYISGSTAYSLGSNGQSPGANNWISSDLGIEVINASQQFFYSLVNITNGAASVSFTITDYIVANGDS